MLRAGKSSWVKRSQYSRSLIGYSRAGNPKEKVILGDAGSLSHGPREEQGLSEDFHSLPCSPVMGQA